MDLSKWKKNQRRLSTCCVCGESFQRGERITWQHSSEPKAGFKEIPRDALFVRHESCKPKEVVDIIVADSNCGHALPFIAVIIGKNGEKIDSCLTCVNQHQSDNPKARVFVEKEPTKQ